MGILLCATTAMAAWAGWLSYGVPLLVCGLLFTTLILGTGLASAKPGWGVFGPTLNRTDSERHVALTFDDGPVPGVTERLLDALGDRHRATFFVLLDRAEAHPELTRRLAENHEVALHGATHHPWLTLQSPERGGQELLDARRRLEALIGRPVPHYRPPFGAVSPRLYASAARAGLRVIWCSLRTGDGGSISGETLRRRVQAAAAGDIVLLHDGRATTAETLPSILADLEARNLTSETVESSCHP